MAVFQSINQYRKSINTRLRNMTRRGRANANIASKQLVLLAKKNAPRRSGDLTKSIRRFKTKNGYSVRAGYSKQGFNIGRYTNMELNKSMSFTRRYPTRNATARVNPWWTKSIEETRRKYKSGYKNVRAALRG